MNEYLFVFALGFCLPLLVVGFFSFVLHYFVALGAPPTRRALWTAGLAYGLGALALTFSAPPEYALWGPIIATPAGLIMFLFWRKDFRQDWFENPDDVPEGTELMDDDWRIGLLRLAIATTGLVALAVYKAIMRSI